MRKRLGRDFGAHPVMAPAWLALLFLTRPAAALTGYPLLLLDPDARSAARGESGLAVTEGMEGFFQQPAATALLGDDAVTLLYVDHLQDLNVLSTSWGSPRPAPWSIGVGILALDYGKLTGLDEQGVETGAFDAGETLLLAGLARRLPDQWGGRLIVGAQAGLLLANIDDARSSAVLANAGAGWRRGQLALGLAVRNLGAVLSDFGQTPENLPATLELGAAWRLEHLPFTWSLDWQKIRERDPFFKLGGEFQIAERWRLGLGYHVERGDERITGVTGEGGRGFSLGVGGSLPHGIDLHWAWSSYGELGALNLLSLTWRYRQ